MKEHLMCSVLKEDEVAVRGNSITFTFASENHTYYLTEEAMMKLIGELAKGMYEGMASQIVHVEREKDELRSRIDYEMNDHRQQVEEGKADWAVDENA